MSDEKKEQKPEELKKKLEECEKKSAEYLAGWQRARADFINYKKEEMERIEQFLKYGEEEFILKILPVLDNFDLAEKELPESLKEDESAKGLLQIKTQILDLLKNQGVEEIKTIGEKFDPNFHEATEQVEGNGSTGSPQDGSTGSPQGESGVVAQEVQRGYTINGRLLRPAKVKVTK